MPANDLSLLIDAALSAGEIAAGWWRGRPEVWTKSDDSPVSEADLAVDEALRAALCGARPGYGWLSEESPDGPERLAAQHCFVVDPIDGTRAYLHGDKTWAVSIGLTEGSQVVAGVIHLPIRRQTYVAAAGQGAFLNGQPIRVSETADPEGASLLASRQTYAAQHWDGDGPPGFARAFRPSMAYRLACVGEGRHDAMLTLRKANEWDIAAGALIAREAGAHVTDRHGAPLVFNTASSCSDGVVAANPVLHGAILSALA